MGTSGGLVTTVEEVGDGLGLIVLAEDLAELRKLFFLFFASMFEEEVASTDHSFSILVQADSGDIVSVELCHGLLDLLMVLPVLLGGSVHAMVFHSLVDGELLAVGVDSSLVNNRVGNVGAKLLVLLLVSFVEAVEEVLYVHVVDLDLVQKAGARHRGSRVAWVRRAFGNRWNSETSKGRSVASCKESERRHV